MALNSSSADFACARAESSAAQAAVGSQATTAIAEPAGATHLSALTCLLPEEVDPHVYPGNIGCWLYSCTNLTSLSLHIMWDWPDFQLLAGLQQLQSLQLHAMAGGPQGFICSGQLAPLTACSQLSHLQLDSFLMQPAGLPEQNPAAGANDDDASHARTAATGSWLQHLQLQHPWTLPLPSLCELSVGNIGHTMWAAAVVTLAPNLTRLQDVSIHLQRQKQVGF